MSMRAIDKIESVKVDSLKPFERNSRRHSESQVKQLVNAISQWGFTIPILIDENNTVLAGHARLLAAQSLRLETVPCIVASDWSDDQKRAYVIADNKLAENSEWDTSVYFSELKELSNKGFDISLTGLDEELGALSYQPNLEPVGGYAEITPDDVAAAQETIGQIKPSSQSITQVVCPHCGEDFEFAGM